MSSLPPQIKNKMDLKIITSKLVPMLDKKCTFKALNEIFDNVDLGEYSVEILNMVASSKKNSKHVIKLAMTLSDENWIAAEAKRVKVSMDTVAFLLEQQFKNMATNFVIWKDIAKSQKKKKYPSLSPEAMTSLFSCIEWKEGFKLEATSYYREYDAGKLNTRVWLEQVAFINRCMDWRGAFEIDTPQDEIDFLNKYLDAK